MFHEEEKRQSRNAFLRGSVKEGKMIMGKSGNKAFMAQYGTIACEVDGSLTQMDSGMDFNRSRKVYLNRKEQLQKKDDIGFCEEHRMWLFPVRH